MSDDVQVPLPRAALFVDGFNLYYPIHALGRNHLKWLNLWALGELLATERGHQLVSVTYCTAYPLNQPARLARHQTYVKALEAVGVKIQLGHYLVDPGDPCSNCGTVDSGYSEKQTDINVALSAFIGAVKDDYDHAYILSADSDQAATFKHIKAVYPNKGLLTVAPPNQPVSQKSFSHAGKKRELNERDIERSRFADVVMPTSGYPVRCPPEYAMR